MVLAGTEAPVRLTEAELPEPGAEVRLGWPAAATEMERP